MLFASSDKEKKPCKTDHDLPQCVSKNRGKEYFGKVTERHSWNYKIILAWSQKVKQQLMLSVPCYLASDISITDLEEVIEGTCPRFADDIKLGGGPVDTL